MKSVLNYFVRKAFGFTATAKPTDKTLFGHLLRIRQNIREVYEWLYSRLSAEHLPRRMPMTEAVVDPNGDMGVEPLHRPVAQNTDTLLAHLRLLDGRKISNGYADGTPAADGLPDGVSLARLLCDSSLQPTELIDDNVGWTIAPTGTPSAWLTVLPKLTKAVFSCKKYYRAAGLGGYNGFIRSDIIKEVYFPNMEEVEVRPYDNALIYSCAELEVVECPNLSVVTSGFVNAAMFWGNQPKLRKLVLGTLTGNSVVFCGNSGAGSRPNLLHLEIGEGTRTNLSFMQYWQPSDETLSNPLFLQNFRSYIASRLAVLPQGQTLTLTLSQAVYNVVMSDTASPSISQIVNDKGWELGYV